MRDLLHRRFVYRARCTRACRVSATLTVRGWTTIARARAARRRPGTARLVLHVASRRVRAKLVRRTKVDATLTIRVAYPRAHRLFALHRAVRIARI
jgi:hypothetical protein